MGQQTVQRMQGQLIAGHAFDLAIRHGADQIQCVHQAVIDSQVDKAGFVDRALAAQAIDARLRVSDEAKGPREGWFVAGRAGEGSIGDMTVSSGGPPARISAGGGRARVENRLCFIEKPGKTEVFPARPPQKVWQRGATAQRTL
jgi:hypothetical protein